MEDSREHAELMTRLAVFEATVTGKFDSIINHLGQLNSKTNKNIDAIQDLQMKDKDIMSMIYSQNKDERDRQKLENQREDDKERRQDGWKKRWQDLLFGTLGWILPAIIIGILLNGRKIAEFLNFGQ